MPITSLPKQELAEEQTHEGTDQWSCQGGVSEAPGSATKFKGVMKNAS